MADPQSPNYLKKMETLEKTLEAFLASDAFKQTQIQWGCHSSRWHYENQTLRVQLFSNGKWACPPPYGWSRKPLGKSCVVVVGTISTHWSRLEKIGVTLENAGIADRSFDQILEQYPDRAKELVAQLYIDQLEDIKTRTRDFFAYLKKTGASG